jgi:hypothetical protein
MNVLAVCSRTDFALPAHKLVDVVLVDFVLVELKENGRASGLRALDHGQGQDSAGCVVLSLTHTSVVPSLALPEERHCLHMCPLAR